MAKKSSPETTKHHAGGVDLPEIEKILEFMQKHGLEEFEYERGGLKIRLKKPSSSQGMYRAMPAPEIVFAAGAPPAASAPPASGPAPVRDAPPSADTQRAEDLHIVKSPIVGTFIRRPVRARKRSSRWARKLSPGRRFASLKP